MKPDQFVSKLNAMANVSLLLPGAMAETGQTSLKFFLASFDRGGYTKGDHFVPWRKRKYHVNHKLLNDTGHLRAGFKLTVKGRQGFTITNDVPYAPFQDQGDKELPKRPLLYESKKLNKHLTDQLTKQLKNLFK